MTLAEARARPAVLNAARFGGYDDWRLPTIKELYSLMNFAGTDPSGATGNDTSGLTPFIDRAYFDFGYGDTARGERIIDMQYASSTLYVSTTMLGSPTIFGVNFADGRIKGYTLDMATRGRGTPGSSSGSSAAPPTARTTSRTTATAPSPTGPPASCGRRGTAPRG